MALGNYANGIGNITTITTSNVVTGVGTTFLTQFKVGTVIGNVSNNFVGFVSNIISNTSLTLSANANVAISSSVNPTNFHYRPMTANTAVYTYYTSGNITANVNSKVITGNSTAFATQLSYGDSIWIANANVGPNTFLGTVELITSNTSLYLNANSLANVSNLQFYNVALTYESPNFGPGSAFNEPNLFQGLTNINTQIFNWTRSGFIPNVAVVNNYHPPIRDSVTGVLVNLPASIYKKTSNISSNSYTLGSSLNADGNAYVVFDFDVNQNLFGTDSSYVWDSLHNSSDIREIALQGDSSLFKNNISRLVEPTAADRAAQFLGGNVARVTDTIDLARQYFSKDTPLTQILDNGGTNLTSNQDINLRKEAKGLRKLVPTGAPMAIPGLLNAVADTYVPGNIAWTPPTYKKTNVR